MRFNSRERQTDTLALTSKGLSLLNKYNFSLTTITNSFCMAESSSLQSFCLEGEGDTLLYFYFVKASNSFDGANTQVKVIKFNI